jgi:MFS family permease
MLLRKMRLPFVPGVLRPDFWKFLIGETISNFGSSFTTFAWPLLVYKLTGSAFYLALTGISIVLPSFLFGFILGTYVDRTNRKKLMIFADLGNALLLALIPVLAWLHLLAIWQLYVAGFIGSTLTIAFGLAQSTALPWLVERDDLVSANGWMQATSSAARVVGPLLAGLLTVIMPLAFLLFFDSFSFLVSAGALMLIKARFNTTMGPKTTSFRTDTIEGFRYVLRHPVMRAIALMAALLNLVGGALTMQLIVFAKQHLQASDTQVGLLFSMGGIGVIVCSLLAGSIGKHWSFSTLVLGTTMMSGLLFILLAVIPWYWVALPLWALISGVIVLFNIAVISLRQSMVSNDMLGRVTGVSSLLGQAFGPPGILLGGWLVMLTNQVALIYEIGGITICSIAIAFSCTALRHTQRYLPPKNVS